jgi:hypothetical protein
LVCAPARAGVKLSDRVTVKVAPEPDAKDPPRFRVHWLFEREPADPSIPPEATVPVPASFTNCAVLMN